MVGLMVVRRMRLDGGQSEMHRLLALERLNVADARMTPEQAPGGGGFGGPGGGLPGRVSEN
ncbi:hypothetical protein [Actinomadura logoneensis]|uniref:hypothetical protein n=1 Tax=Actinomadura logoneensis TaxID=2293572 RepID=UPI001F45F199|nr:hypothetical protein [Actinomadura logoneensis]